MNWRNQMVPGSPNRLSSESCSSLLTMSRTTLWVLLKTAPLSRYVRVRSGVFRPLRSVGRVPIYYHNAHSLIWTSIIYFNRLRTRSDSRVKCSRNISATRASRVLLGSSIFIILRRTRRTGTSIGSTDRSISNGTSR